MDRKTHLIDFLCTALTAEMPKGQEISRQLLWVLDTNMIFIGLHGRLSLPYSSKVKAGTHAKFFQVDEIKNIV